MSVVDAFAERPFTGNPAAVCLLDGPADETWMQHVAAEMNLSETAFLYPDAKVFQLRWFTPAAEVDLCGHGACDFVSRFFAPAVGISEDPVTGSAHCCLAPFWATRLGKTDLIGHQVSARGGVVRVSVRGDRVRLGGSAVTVLRGELLAERGRADGR